MNQNYIFGAVLVLIHVLFVICYILYIFLGNISQRYINIVFFILIGLVSSSILFDGCFLTHLERYYMDDYEWKGITREVYKRVFGFKDDYELAKYLFMIIVCFLYIGFINRLKLHKNSVSRKYFDYLLTIK